MKNNLFIVILISVLVSLVAGALGALFINNQSLSSYGYFGFGQELNLNDYNYLSPGLVIQDPKKVIVNQDVKIDEAITSLKPSILGVFLKQATSSSAYYLDEAFAQSLVATTDGWVMAVWPSDTKDLSEASLMKDYVLIDSNNKVYDIEKAIIAPSETGWFVFFKLLNASALNIRRLVDDEEVRIGQSMILLNNTNEAYLDTLSSKKMKSAILSSDKYPYNLNFKNKPKNEALFVFNLSGDIIGVFDAQNKWLSASDIEIYWRSLFKITDITRAMLGVNYVDLSQWLISDQPEKGALLKASSSTPAVIAKSPAALAGLLAGDVISKINGVEINEDQNLSILIGDYNPGDKILLQYIRQGEIREVEIILANVK